MRHFNQLSPAEHERLSLLMEEMAEAIAMIGKILRHGYESHNPEGDATVNRGLLEEEFGHVLAAYHMMLMAGDVSGDHVGWARDAKLRGVQQWLHHQERVYDHPTSQ